MRETLPATCNGEFTILNFESIVKHGKLQLEDPHLIDLALDQTLGERLHDQHLHLVYS